MNFGVPGRRGSPSSACIITKARIYSPTLGRFLQTDPVRYQDQVNLYAYVGNDPVNAADPTGTDTVVTIRKDGVHAFVVLQDTESSKVVIVRGGPSEDYLGHYLSPASGSSSGSSSSGSGSSSSRASSGLSSGTASERSRGSSSGSSGRPGLRLEAETRPAALSADESSYRRGDTVVLGSTVVAGEFSATVGVANNFTNSVNAANLDCRALSQNSNSVAGTAYEQITGQTRPANPDWTPLPAYSVNLCERGVPCLPR